MILARVGLAALGAAVIAALVLGLRATRAQERAVAIVGPPLAYKGAVGDAFRLLDRAEVANADVRPLILRGQLSLFVQRPREALAPLEDAVRREPDNVDAWTALALAAQGVDPRRAREARERVRQLKPPVGS